VKKRGAVEIKDILFVVGVTLVVVVFGMIMLGF